MRVKNYLFQKKNQYLSKFKELKKDPKHYQLIQV